jgi:hypothetical protein
MAKRDDLEGKEVDISGTDRKCSFCSKLHECEGWREIRDKRLKP